MILRFLLAAFAASATLHAAPPPFLLLEETTSPNGRYAVGWKLPAKDQAAWEVINSRPEQALDEIDGLVDHVENFFVDVQKGKILRKVASSVWELPGGAHGNHRTVEVAWAPASDYAVTIYSLKWNYASAEAVYVNSAGVAVSTDIGKALEATYRQLLANKAGQRYKRVKDRLAISFNEPKPAARPGEFDIAASALVPKSEVEGDEMPEATLHLALGMNNGGLYVKSVEAGSLPASNSRLTEADRKLNTAYGALRATLAPAQREALKKEQLAWLTERDKIAEEGRKAEFVEARAAALQGRLRKK